MRFTSTAKSVLPRSLAVVALWLSANLSLAQSDPPTPTTETKPPAATGVKEVKPEVFYLKDKDGNLQPIAGMTLEEFRRLYDLSQGITTLAPSYSIGNLKVVGKVRDGKAEFDAEVKFTLKAKEGGWVRIPLKFTTAVLREPPQHDGKGDLFFDYEPEGEGYICWLRAAENSEHILRCKFVAKAQELGTESRLSLSAPRATSGSLSLRVPEAQAKARVLRRNEEFPLDVVADGNGSRLEMLGPAGDFQIAWRAASSTSPTLRRTLEAQSNVLIKLEANRRITYESRMRLRSFGAPLDVITIRLPPGMKLVSHEQPGVQLNVMEPEVDRATQQQIQIVEARFANKTNGPTELTVIAEYTRDPAANQQPVEVGGFEVVDAVKQWGTVDLQVEQDQSAIWLEGANIRRSQEDATSSKSLARFEYDAQPYSLQVQVVPSKTRVTVEPLYVVYVENGQLRLDATLKYKVRGAKATSLEYEFAGWTIERIGPETLVNNESLQRDKTTPLVIPLNAAGVPASGEFEVKILAHRDLPTDAENIAFDVPRPIGSQLTPGNVVLLPADNVELTTQTADLVGLISDPLAATVKLPPRQQSPLFFRELGGGAAAHYAATLAVHDQMISVTTSGQARFAASSPSVEVEQKLNYNVAYVGVRNLEIQVPRTLWESRRLQVLRSGTVPSGRDPWPTPSPRLSEDDDPTSPLARVRVDLMNENIGRIELVVKYAWLPNAAPSPSFTLPLVRPLVAGAPVKSALVLGMMFPAELEVATRDSGWTIAQPTAAAEAGLMETVWTHSAGTNSIQCDVQPRRAESSSGSTIERAWQQTWLTQNARQDRAVFCIVTVSSKLNIQMPSGVRAATLVAAVDGHRVLRRMKDTDAMLTLDLPPATKPTEHVVELWYDFGEGRPAIGQMQFTAPQILGAGEAQHAYWQLVLPRDEHLLSEPGSLTPDMKWQWRGTHLGRTSRLSQGELESWIKASSQPDLPSGVNTYLFSSFGSPHEISLRTAARQWILLVCSGIALAIGLALLYVRAVRHPLALLAAGIGVAMLGLWLPDIAVIAAQAAVMGLACVVLASLLRGLYSRREVRGVTVRGISASSIIHRPSMPLPRYEAGSQATTATAPLATALPVESEL